MVVSLHGHQMPEQVRAARLLDVYEHEGISASRVERDIGQRSRLNLTVGSSARDGERSVRESLSGQATGVQPLEALLRMPECSPEEETDGRQEHGKYHHQLLRLHAMSQYSPDHTNRRLSVECIHRTLAISVQLSRKACIKGCGLLGNSCACAIIALLLCKNTVMPTTEAVPVHL